MAARESRFGVQLGAIVLLLVFARAMGLPLGWVLGGLFAWALASLVPWRRASPAPAASLDLPAPSVRGTVEPPTDRHGYKPPTTLAALIQALRDGRLGEVRSEGASARLVLPDGEWVVLTAPDAGAVTQRSLVLEGSSVAALALACDALAPLLGTMRLSAAGVSLDIDGTRPRAMLLADVASAVEAEQMRRRTAERIAGLAASQPDQGDQYLN